MADKPDLDLERARALKKRLELTMCPHNHQLIRRMVNCDVCLDESLAAEFRAVRLDEARLWDSYQGEWNRVQLGKQRIIDLEASK